MLSDEELLDKVQAGTLRYFTDFAHPVSGMARERSNDAFDSYKAADTVTSGGTGFGIMAMIAGTERGFIPRPELVERLTRIVDFLETKAERFHGAFSHFIDGETGRVIPFSEKDDGGDLVETSFLIAGLLAAREYLGADEADLRAAIDRIWHAVEWDHYLRADGALLWHFSPRHGFAINLPIAGWNECLITHLLAAASPTHGIGPASYHGSWAKGNDFVNGRTYNGITLPLGPEKGGPLFFSHYSFLGLDPRGLKDVYADYWEQNVAHTRINHAHCVTNPLNHGGYGKDCWGLTASDDPKGYDAHSPTNDDGVITPTAALSAFPYLPQASMRALRHFHDARGNDLWRDLGFADAFHPGTGWVAESHLAIDQGPIVVMIENHRSGLLWNLFMRNPDVQAGLRLLGFESPWIETVSV
ncbi:hypothetical protein HDIA_2394 [Hartmannibacter diazotrophicus]|uniref:Glycoamylase-like domain-containing protein n=1 Tax=Hartmannibacter diazotrophicus TaxID=1482074 RepID=A0A2C9D8N8_9HYPH|nr:glucoamylase family protein [Hartmannibacter diazotrophicus]SON55935.1 hypothetical protein HDIA_2394 [Hartmannibacter diazotrophicus]